MSSETFTYKGISAGKYVEGDIEALNQEEASFKLKEQKIIITNLVKTKKKKAEKAFPSVASMIDKLAKRNIIHNNKAANLKSKLAQHIASL